MQPLSKTFEQYLDEAMISISNVARAATERDEVGAARAILTLLAHIKEENSIDNAIGEIA